MQQLNNGWPTCVYAAVLFLSLLCEECDENQNAAAAEREVFVKNGRPVAVIGSGTKEMRVEGNVLVIPGALERDFGDAPPWKVRGFASFGWGNTLEADVPIQGDFHVHARLSLPKLGGTDASLIMGGGYHHSHVVPEGRHATRIWLDGADGKMYVRDYMTSLEKFRGFPLSPFNLEVVSEKYPHVRTAGRHAVGKVSDYIKAGKAFTLDLVRKGNLFTFRIDGKKVFASELRFRRWPAMFGFLADQGTLRIHEFWAEGTFVRPALKHVDLWLYGTEGYNSYRQATLCVTTDGTILAFSSARRVGSAAPGERDLVMKRSEDGGRTWSKTRMVWDTGNENFYQRDPTPLVDRETGEVFVLVGANVPRPGAMDESSLTRLGVFLLSSKDDGRSWSEPRPLENINDRISHLTAACSHGIQLRHAPYKGRLLIPGWTKVKIEGSIRSAVIYSDDHGKTWNLGGTVAVSSAADEPAVVELADGSILMTGRGRGVFTSEDGGESFDAVDWRWHSRVGRQNPTLVRYDWSEKGQNPSQERILYCDVGRPMRRAMVVRMSYDGCKTWPVSRFLYHGGAGYSDMVVLPDGRIAIAYDKDDYRRISFATFDLDWLTEER